MNLAETQALFHSLASGEPGADPRAAELVVAGTPELPAAERVAIYAGMWLGRQADALRADFPMVAAALGDERFRDLCAAYLRAHPSEDPDVGRLGRRMASFLRSRPDLARRPDLADLAALEWARLEVFFEAPWEPAGREALAALGPEAFPGARLRLAPALRLVLLDHDAAELFRRLDAGEPPGVPAPGPCAAAVWRREFEVLHAPLDLDEALALEAALAGDPLARVCAAFARRERPAEAAFEALRSWADEGWIAGVSP